LKTVNKNKSKARTQFNTPHQFEASKLRHYYYIILVPSNWVRL